MRKLLVVLVLVVVLSGCNRAFTLFPLVIEVGDAQEHVALIERPGRAGEEEGYLGADRRSIRLEPREPLPPLDEGSGLVATLTGNPHGIAIAVLDERGSEVARRAVRDGIPASVRGASLVIALPVPPGTQIAAVTLNAGPVGEDADPDPRKSVDAVNGSDSVRREPRLTGLRIGRVHPGVGYLPAQRGGARDPHSGGEAGERAFYIPPGAVVREWGPVEGAKRWSVDASSVRGWDSNTPVEIRYRLDPAAVREAAAEQDIEVPRATVTGSGRALELELRPGANRVVLYPEVEGTTLDRLSIDSRVSGLELEWVGPAAPVGELPSAVPVEFGTLKRYPPELWRTTDYELFSWTIYPHILIVDSISYEVQASFFKRLAFFVEKRGFRGRILTDAELSGRHGYNAHNYNARGLAEFFQAATETGVTLTREELLLRDIAVEHGIIRATGGRFEPGVGGILAVSQESNRIPGLRELLVAHEAYHGVYYAEPDYVEAVDRLWSVLSPDEQRYWKLLLSGLGYDVDDPYLLRNEYHAYLMQQQVSSASWYFESRSAGRIARWYPGTTEWLNAFLADYRGTHRRQAARVQAALFEHTGLVARDVFCLEPMGTRR